MKSGRLQIWVPELVAREGGIQSYSIEMVEAAVGILGAERVTVISKSDRPGALRRRLGDKVKIYATGNVPNAWCTPVFAILLVVAAWWERPSLILSTHANFSPVAAWLQKWMGIPAAISAHGVEVWDLAEGAIRQALCKVAKILPVSEYTRGRMEREIGLPADRFEVIPDTFDPGRFFPGPMPKILRGKYGIGLDDIVLLSVSRLVVSEQYKGYRKILEVLPRLIESLPKLKFVLVGRGDDRPNVEKMIRDLGLEKKVVLTGYVPDAELADHYRMADFFAMPSKREGFGIVFLEAMGCGIRCLGGNKDAAADALRQGELGILVDPDDANDVERGLRQLLTESPPEPKKLHELANRYFGRDSFRVKVRTLLGSFNLR
jgi:glycosyltransferase involved in cell wall biosynthesis